MIMFKILFVVISGKIFYTIYVIICRGRGIYMYNQNKCKTKLDRILLKAFDYQVPGTGAFPTLLRGQMKILFNR